MAIPSTIFLITKQILSTEVPISYSQNNRWPIPSLSFHSIVIVVIVIMANVQLFGYVRADSSPLLIAISEVNLLMQVEQPF